MSLPPEPGRSATTDLLIGRGIALAALRTPAKTALVIGRRRLTFTQLNAAIERIAARLADLGIERGDRLAVRPRAGPEPLLVLLAAARLGVVTAILPGPAGGDDQQQLLRQLRPRLVLTLDDQPPAWSQLAQDPFTGRARWQARPDDPFLIGYTSGSSGRPKGVVRAQRAWALSFVVAAREFGLGAADRMAVVGPLSFSAPLFHACQALELGATLYLIPAFRPRSLARLVAEERITAAFMVPTHYRALLAAAADALAAAGHLRTLLSCGEKLPPPVRAELMERLPHATVYEYYGSSEIGFTTVLPPAAPATSVGRPFLGVEIAIRGPDGRPLPAGAPGILYGRSAMTASGYLGEDGELVPLADGDGWVTAGDVAYRGADGLIYLIGRSDDAINSGGVKIYPAEIERVLAEHPAVDQAVVLGWPDRRRGEAVIAAVVARAGTSVTAAELRAFCAARLAPGRRPQRILLLPELPRTAGGKVAREALRQLLQRLLA